MGKAKTKDDPVFGVAGAAAILGCEGRTVTRHAKANRLPFICDSSGKRLYKLSDLERFKRANHIGNQNRLPANDARNSAPFASAKKKRRDS